MPIQAQPAGSRQAVIDEARMPSTARPKPSRESVLAQSAVVWFQPAETLKASLAPTGNSRSGCGVKINTGLIMRQIVSMLLAGLIAGNSFAAELPVKKIVLYKHGIGYFERRGEIPAGESARLDFKSGDMNDVLKSLTVFDQTGNSVSGVRYDSSMALGAKLAEFPFKLGDRTPLVDFLDQLKGAKIEMKFGATVVSGQIVGARTAPGRERTQTMTELVTVLTPGGEMVTQDLGGATSMRLVDAELQLQLSEYLRSLNVSRSREQKSVYIDSAKDAARKLSVAYAIPMPVWKSSYRLVLDAGEAKKPVLEGWAILDNTTSEDWTRVELSVISGQPISFISKLYEPKYVTRQVVELEEEQPLAPKVYRAGAKQMAPMAAANMMAGRRAAGDALAAAEAQMSTATSTLEVQTTAREAGELFEYKFGQLVTVKRNESAMLPFVQQPIEARKLLIYTEGSNRENPLNSVELTNTTGKTLDGGPLSVYDGGVYAGEALVNTFKAADKRLLSYASDLGTRVVEDGSEGEAVLRVLKAVRGVLTVTMISEAAKTYKITNVDRKSKTLMIEHPLREGYKVVGQKPSEETKTHTRFEVKLTGEAAQTYTVKEERTIVETVMLSEAGGEQIALWVRSNRLTPEAKQVLSAIAALRGQVAEAQRTIEGLGKQVAEATGDQERVRRNLSSLNNVSGQQERVQRYATELANLDARIVSLRDQIAAEGKRKDSLSGQLEQKIEAATF